MNDSLPATRYRFGIFEADLETGELRRKGIRVKINAQPFQLLVMLLERHGELVSREEIAQRLWPDGTFVDFDHGVNSAINRIREALGDRAVQPCFVETLARRGYRFVAPVEQIDSAAQASDPAGAGPHPAAESATRNGWGPILATAEELPHTPHRVVVALFVALQLMYIGFYVGALANLAEIDDLLSALPWAKALYNLTAITAAALIAVRAFALSGALLHPPGARSKLLRLWPVLLVMDEVWALSPFLLLHHINFGLAVACTALLVYSPFAQRSLLLMGAAEANPER